MPAPKAVVFDIGNVLITWDPETLYGPLLPEDERDALSARACLHEMNVRIDCGAPWRETVYATAEQYPEYADLIRLWHERWMEMFTPPIDGSLAILRSLRRQGVPVFALSNFGRETLALAETHYPILTEFDRRFISGHLGVMKPDSRIYEIVEEESGLIGADLFFTDDRAENIEAAKARGWQAHLFTTPEALAGALRTTGLHPATD